MPYKANFGLRIQNNVATAPNLNDDLNAEFQEVYAAAQADVATSISHAGVPSLTNVRGTANRVEADLTGAISQLGTTIEAWTTVDIVPVSTNTAAVRLNVAGVGFLDVVHEDGSPLEPGDFRAGIAYILRRRGTHWRIMESGLRKSISDAGQNRTWVTTAASIAGQTPDPISQIILQITGNYTAIWGKTNVPPPGGVATESQVKDIRDQWWIRRFDSRDVNNGRVYVQWTNHPGAKNIPLGASVVLCVTSSTYTLWTPAAEPANGEETQNLKVDNKGRWWLKVPVEERNTGGGTVDLDTLFLNPDAEDPIRYVIGRAGDGSPLLGFYEDGSWATSPFGSIRWPGDDIVVFRTQTGEPVMAFTPDGTLLAKFPEA